MKKLLAHESLLFLCSLGFGVVIIPTMVMLVCALFGDMPRKASLAEGYDELSRRLGNHHWIAYVVAFGPYVGLQCLRIVRRRQGHSTPRERRKHPSLHHSPRGLHCDFSLLSWKDGLAQIERPEEVKEPDDA